MDLLTLLIVICVLAWATGNFFFGVGSLIHVLLIIAVVIFIVKLLRGEKLV